MRSSVLSVGVLLANAWLVTGRGGSHGGGGGGGGDGTSDGAGLSSLYYYPDECYDALNPKPKNMGDSTNYTTAQPGNQWYIYKNDFYTRGAVENQVVQPGPFSNTSGPYVNTNWQFDILDVYYNGSFSITLEPNETDSRYSSCPEITSQTIPDYYLRVGPQSRNNITREPYDSNPFYFAFGLTIRSVNCPATSNKLFAALESDNDNLNITQIWDLTVQKSANGSFDLAGSLNSEAANNNNYYNYLVNTTGTDSSYPVNSSCPIHFNEKGLTSLNKVTMTATIDAGSAFMTWDFVDSIYGHAIHGQFHGVVWDKGAQLDTSGNTIATTGQSQRIAVYKPKSFDFWADDGKWVIIGGVVFVVLFGGYFAWRCFSCCRKRHAKQSYGAVPMKPIHGDGSQEGFVGQQQPLYNPGASNHAPYSAPTYGEAPPAYNNGYSR